MLRAEEVELLVCGNPSLDVRELRRVAIYDGYTADDDTIRCLHHFVCVCKCTVFERGFCVTSATL